MRMSAEEHLHLFASEDVVVSKRCQWPNKMYQKLKWRYMMIILGLTFVFGVVYLGYFCEESECALSPRPPTPHYKTQLDAYMQGGVLHENFDSGDLHRKYDFDSEGTEVIVFLHIQKTGGTTFGRHLVKDLNIPCQCFSGRKRCDCENRSRQTWLFSRFSVGWPCGLHADWTELQSCADSVLEEKESVPRQRRYLYITMLRDPVARYLSEWTHVARGATWLAAQLKCNGRTATLQEVPFCFDEEDWTGVRLDEFMDCPYNLATNRQTRMLADLTLVGCYNRSAMPQAQRDRIILQSAKDNLRDMAFFGLTEYQQDTQDLFEHTFNLKFTRNFDQYNQTHARKADNTPEQQKRILELNKLDIELYQYAKDLFRQRVKMLHSKPESRRTNTNVEREADDELEENYVDEDEEEEHGDDDRGEET